jgi:predicted NBD/HSP70 family sugar kinase
MKSLNAIEILELVRTRGPISRAHLAACSRLSKPTVSDQVDALISRGLVVEAGPGDSGTRGGKKPTLVEFNGGHGQIFCADVGPELIRFAAADLRGTVFRRNVLPTQPERGPRAVVRTVKKGLADLIGAADDGKVRVISMAVPGIVDIRQGIVLETENVFGWRNLHLAADLAGHFGIPVRIDNDVNMAALAELSGGSAPDDFVFVRLHTGIGAAVVLGGKLHHGAHWAAGEIGHMLLDVGRLPRGTDPRGYLESVVGQDRVSERVRKLARRGGRTAAEQEVSRDVALHLGSAIANIASVCDPHAVILLGEPFPGILDEIRRVTEKLVPWPVEVRLSQLGEDAALQGALAAGLNHAYDGIADSLHAGDGQTLAAEA